MVNCPVQGGGEKIGLLELLPLRLSLPDAEHLATDATSPYVSGSDVPDFVRAGFKEVRRPAAVLNKFKHQ